MSRACKWAAAAAAAAVLLAVGATWTSAPTDQLCPTAVSVCRSSFTEFYRVLPSFTDFRYVFFRNKTKQEKKKRNKKKQKKQYARRPDGGGGGGVGVEQTRKKTSSGPITQGLRISYPAALIYFTPDSLFVFRSISFRACCCCCCCCCCCWCCCCCSSLGCFTSVSLFDPFGAPLSV